MSLGRFIGGAILVVFAIIFAFVGPFLLPLLFQLTIFKSASLNLAALGIITIASLVIALILFLVGGYYAITGLRRTEVIIKHEEKPGKDGSEKDEIEIKSEEDPIKVLKLRYAKGKITKKQFDKMKKDLE